MTNKTVFIWCDTFEDDLFSEDSEDICVQQFLTENAQKDTAAV
jgi:hypothetical protein